MQADCAPMAPPYYRQAYSFDLWVCDVDLWMCGQLSFQWRWLSRIWMLREAYTSDATRMFWRMAARCASPHVQPIEDGHYK